MKHDPKAYMCGCLQCWRNDVADQSARERRREDPVIAEAAEIIKKRKLTNSKRDSGQTDPEASISGDAL